ncbi:hypothetical protein ABW21_db0202609 [Orbilia brochopaga]|nr:hypothetical protein ABW21_db0202609 [Drechslerella brochopaga]
MSPRKPSDVSAIKTEGSPTKASISKSTTSPSKPKSYEEFTKKVKNMEVLVAVLLSSKKPGTFIDTSQIDWNLVAERLGLSNAKCASTRFGQVKKELMACIEANADTVKKDSDGEAGDGIEVVISPPDTPKSAPTPTTMPSPPKTPKNKVTKPKGRRGRGRPAKAKVVEDVDETKVQEAQEDTTDTELYIE